jgi:putative transposase
VVGGGDGALGFWAALRDVWPATREQRCWVHVIANVLDKLPKGLQPKAKSILHAAMNAPDRETWAQYITEFDEAFGAKYPKASASLQDNAEKLQTHFDFPAEHWVHLRTTNPIESTFATVKLRQRVTKGAGSRNAGLAMAFKLLLAAEQHWRKLNGAELLPLVREGSVFVDGERVERKPKLKLIPKTEMTNPKKRSAA